MPNSSTEKLAQLRQEIPGTLFLQKVTAIESFSRHRCGAFFSPSSRHVPQGADCILCAPQDMKWTFDLPTGFIVDFVHFQVDVGGSSEIFTSRVDRCWIRKCADIFLHRTWGNGSRSLVQAPEHFLQKKSRI